MKIVIIDDEQKPRRVLENILVELFPDFSDINHAANLLEGVEVIKKNKPDIVFLDIEMPEHSGLELFKFESLDTSFLPPLTSFNSPLEIFFEDTEGAGLGRNNAAKDFCVILQFISRDYEIMHDNARSKNSAEH